MITDMVWYRTNYVSRNGEGRTYFIQTPANAIFRIKMDVAGDGYSYYKDNATSHTDPDTFEPSVYTCLGPSMVMLAYNKSPWTDMIKLALKDKGIPSSKSAVLSPRAEDAKDIKDPFAQIGSEYQLGYVKDVTVAGK